jgi:hypothetical protein
MLKLLIKRNLFLRILVFIESSEVQSMYYGDAILDLVKIFTYHILFIATFFQHSYVKNSGNELGVFVNQMVYLFVNI